MTRVFVRSFAPAFLFFLCASFAEAEERERIRVLIPERDNLQYLAFSVARGAGYFAARGIDVELTVPNTQGEAEELYRTHTASVAVLSPPMYLRLIAEGEPL